MLSEEEHRLLQVQLVELTEKQLETESKIETEKLKLQQIPMLKQQIEETKQEIEEDEKKFRALEESLRLKISAAKLPKRTMSFNALQLFSAKGSIEKNSEQMQELEAKLEEESLKLSEMADMEAELSDMLEQAAAREQTVTDEIEALEEYIAEYDVIEPKVSTCYGIEMFVQDLVCQVDKLKAERAVQKGRRYRLMHWKEETENVNDHHKSTLLGLDGDKNNVEKSLASEELKLEELQEQLQGLMNDDAQLKLEIADEITEAENVNEKSGEIIAAARDECKRAEASITDIEKQTADVMLDISGYGASKKRILKKKLDLIDQLNKKIQIERENLSVVDVCSPVIEELTARVNDVMLEKEELVQALKKESDKLKRRQSDVEKMNILLEELKPLAMKRYDPKRTEEQALFDLTELVSEREVQNSCYIDDMQFASMQIEGLEKEKQTLHQILSSMD